MDPPDFNLDALGDILGSLSEEDFKNISAFAQSFSNESSDNQNEAQENGQGGFNLDPEMLIRLMSLFEKLNSNRNDPRCNLIYALKPLLSPPRQKKADQAIEMMKIFSLLSDADIFGFQG